MDKTLRDELAMRAPPIRELVDVNGREDISKVCKWLGIPPPPKTSNLEAWLDHGFQFAAALKYKWADAMLRARHHYL